jgi:hypothetical protein
MARGLFAAGLIIPLVPPATDPRFYPRKTQINQKLPRIRGVVPDTGAPKRTFLGAKAAFGPRNASEIMLFWREMSAL